MSPPDRITFFAAGVPRPKGRPRHVRGRAKPISTPAGSLEDLWRVAVRRSLDALVVGWGVQGRPEWLTGALAVDCHFIFPTRDRGRVGRPHLAKPDRDNLDKLVLDQMEKAKVTPNDSRAAAGRLSKSYGLEGGVFVSIRPWEPADAALPELDDDDLGVSLPP